MVHDKRYVGVLQRLNPGRDCKLKRCIVFVLESVIVLKIEIAELPCQVHDVVGGLYLEVARVSVGLLEQARDVLVQNPPLLFVRETVDHVRAAEQFVEVILSKHL